MELAEQFNKVWKLHRNVILISAVAGFAASTLLTFFAVDSFHRKKTPVVSCEKMAADFEGVYNSLTVDNFKFKPVALPAETTTKCRHLTETVFKPLREKMERRLADYEALYRLSIQKNEEVDRLKKQVSFLSNIREQLKTCGVKYP